MAKTPNDPDRSVDAALRNAFRAVEARPVPSRLTDHLKTLAGPKPRPDRRA